MRILSKILNICFMLLFLFWAVISVFAYINGVAVSTGEDVFNGENILININNCEIINVTASNLLFLFTLNAAMVDILLFSIWVTDYKNLKNN